jgi:pimeloyl-ACP methyl ester carboxylesterase
MDDILKTEGIEEHIDMQNIEEGSKQQEFSASANREEFLSGVASPEKTDSDFEQKFDKKVTLDLPNGRVSYRDIEPQKVGEDTSDIPLLMLPGWSMQSPILKDVTSEFYNEGQHVVTVDIEGGGKGVKGEGSSEINRQAELLNSVVNALGKDKVDLTGQSQGVLTVLSLARLHPETLAKIRSIVLVSGVGLGEGEGLIDLGIRQLAEGSRYGKTEKDEGQKAIDKMVGGMVAGNVLKHPIKAWKELNAIAKQNEYATLEQVKEAGVKIAIMQGEQDKLAGTDRLWKKIGDGYESPFEKSDETPSGFKYVPQEGVETPPFDVITMTGGGHEVFGSKVYAKKMMQALNTANSPQITPRKS